MRRCLLFALALLIAPATAAAQSLFSMHGLGVPIAPLDARAYALGGIGVGLLGSNTSLVSPAEISSVRGRGLTAGIQPVADSPEFEGRSDVVGSTRFPLVHVVLPFGERVVAGVGYGGFLDRSWTVQTESETVIGGDVIGIRDVTRSTGGVSQARVSLAYDLLPSLTVGVAGGVYTGSVNRTILREFETDGSNSELRGFELTATREFSGPLAAVGLRWDPSPEIRFGASARWGGELKASAGESDVEAERYDLPWKFSAGMSAAVTPRLAAVLGGNWTGWESVNSSLDPAVAADSWELGGGLEWTRSEDERMPLRAGFRYGRLPFTVNGAAPSEWAASLGAGLHVAPGQRFSALIDGALERGGRGDAASTGLTEGFWRFTLTMSVFEF